jgi:hypothetical protein
MILPLGKPESYPREWKLSGGKNETEGVSDESETPDSNTTRERVERNLFHPLFKRSRLPSKIGSVRI